jgi:hypothetical protein
VPINSNTKLKLLGLVSFSDKNVLLLFLRKQIRNPSGKNELVKVYKLAHQPGAGATTVAMSVLWNLRRDFRCIKIDNCSSDNVEDIATNAFGDNILLYVFEYIICQTTFDPDVNR